jgi:predicted dehydrogenase
LIEMAEVVRLGLIGAGRWGCNYIRTIADLDQVRLAMVASRNPDTATLVPSGCSLVDHWRAVVDAPGIDGVVIATPPATHAKILITAIECGKPVLVEKPVVQSRAEASCIRTALERQPVPIIVDHVHLFHPAFRALYRQASQLGPVRSIKSAAGNRGPYRKNVSVLWDWAPHDLAMCLTLVPGAARPIAAACLEAKSVEGVRAKRIALDLELEGAVPAHIQVSTIDDRHRWFAAIFDDCILVYRDTGGRPLLRLPPGADVQAEAGVDIPVTVESPLTRAVLEFVAAIRDGNLDRSSIDLGLTVVDLLSDFEILLGPERRAQRHS